MTAGRQQLTRAWWQTERERYEIFVSLFVLDEAEAGDAEAATERADVLKGLPLIEPDERTNALAERLMREVPLPEKAIVDAAHIAIAAVGGMDYLLTWNFKHIANAVLRDRIERICRSSGYKPPVICHAGRATRRDAMSETPGARDEVIEQVRAVREAYAERFDYNLSALFRHARERTRQVERQVVKRQPKRVEEETLAPKR